MLNERTLLIITGAIGASGVIAGAFGAHALADYLAEHGRTTAWEAAVLYQMIHAVALLAIHPRLNSCGRCFRAVTGFWLAGILLFSGSLYWLCLGGPKWLGPVTPIGGFSLILGWIWVIIAALRPEATSSEK